MNLLTDWLLDFVVLAVKIHLLGSMVSFGIMLWRYCTVWKKRDLRPKVSQMFIFSLCVGWFYTIDIVEWWLKVRYYKRKRRGN